MYIIKHVINVKYENKYFKTSVFLLFSQKNHIRVHEAAEKEKSEDV